LPFSSATFVSGSGFIFALKVTPAGVQDRDGSRLLLPRLTQAYGWLKRIWADGGYAGQLEGEVARLPRHRQRMRAG
jgi:hypothetical protein